MWIVLFVIMLDIIGFGIIGPVFPFYLKQLGAGPEMVGFYLALFTAALFISTPILGRLSDRYGRKPIMIFGVLGSVIGMGTVHHCNELIDDALAKGAKLVCGGKAVRAQVRGHGQREGEEEEGEGESAKAAIVASSSFFLSVSS